MTDSKIYEDILSFEKRYKNAKDGGISFIKDISKAINKSENREIIISFMLKEIRDNKYNLYSFSFAVIEEIGDKSLNEKLFKIYVEVFSEKDNYWTDTMFTLLFKMQFKAPKKIYKNYIKDYIKRKKENSLYTLVLFVYSNSYPELSIEYLSDYFVCYLNKSEEIKENIVRQPYFLFSWFSKSEIDFLPQLLECIKKKDIYVVKVLVNALLNYLKSDLAIHTYKDSFLKERKNILDSFLENHLIT